MKKKIVGIFLMMLLVATTVSVTGTTQTNEKDVGFENKDNIETNVPAPMVLFPNLPRILNKDWNYWANQPNLFSIPTGNVGIGTDTPSEKFEVAGIIYSSIGGFKFPDGSVQTSAAVGGGIDGSGTAGYISKFTASSTIDDSVICEKNGEVGIGTATPSELLHIHNNAVDNTYLRLTNPNAVIGGLAVGMDPYANSFIWNFENSDLIFGTNNDWRMAIDPAGQVGVGTIYPEEKLHVTDGYVKTEPSYGYKLEHNNGWTSEIASHDEQLWISNEAGGEIDFLTGETPGNTNSKVTIYPSGVIHLWGKVGIKTYSPAYELDVEGDIQAKAYHTGDIYFKKDGRELWRMFEDENGLYLESLLNNKVYKFVLEDIEETETLKQKIDDLEARISELEALLK